MSWDEALSGAHPRAPHDLECYSATLRSRCTSSKRHLRSPTVVLAVDVGGALVCSEPFAVFARQPGRQVARECTATGHSEITVARLPLPPRPHDALYLGVLGSLVPPAGVVTVRGYLTVKDSRLGQALKTKYTRNVIRN
eukprot:m51a1_g12833 hypothetical protein (139) ;mRNA; f:1921-2681